MLIALLIFCYFYYALSILPSAPQYYARKNHANSIEVEPVETLANTTHFKKKPEWVNREIIRLAAFMPHNGCRKIADVFNRLHEHKQKPKKIRMDNEAVFKSRLFRFGL
jgi:hypothetical protein